MSTTEQFGGHFVTRKWSGYKTQALFFFISLLYNNLELFYIINLNNPDEVDKLAYDKNYIAK